MSGIVTVRMLFNHIDPRGDRYVDLYYVGGAKWPHGFEMTAERTTNEDGPYATGGLIIEDGGELVDFDGVSELPLAVKAVLKRIGVRFKQEEA